jgi:hypothetical protein
MATLATVADYVADARVLLQDSVDAPYRYSDAVLLQALNVAILEARRLRPDLFLDRFDNLPSFAAVNSTAVDIDPQFRPALVYYMAGRAQMTDEEQTEDARATDFMARFTNILVGLG